MLPRAIENYWLLPLLCCGGLRTIKDLLDQCKRAYIYFDNSVLTLWKANLNSDSLHDEIRNLSIKSNINFVNSVKKYTNIIQQFLVLLLNRLQHNNIMYSVVIQINQKIILPLCLYFTFFDFKSWSYQCCQILNNIFLQKHFKKVSRFYEVNWWFINFCFNSTFLYFANLLSVHIKYYYYVYSTQIC